MPLGGHITFQIYSITVSKTNTLNQVSLINPTDKMQDKILRVKKSRIFVPVTILYAIFIFYLSVTSKIGNLKHLIDITLGQAATEILTAAHLSFILKFLVGSLHFAERQSLDPGHVGIYFRAWSFTVFCIFKFQKQDNRKIFSSFCHMHRHCLRHPE